MRNIFFMALIGVALVLGVLYIVPETEILSLITSVGVFITIFLAAGAKVSADDAARKADEAARKATLSVQASIDNHTLLNETKQVVEAVKSVTVQTHDAVNSTAELLRKAEKEVNVAEGKELGKAEEKHDQAIRDEKEAE